MEALLASFAMLLLFAAIVAMVGLACRAGARSDLQLWKVLARRGIAPSDADAPADARLARAVRRCVLCANVERCDRWLAADEAAGLEQFCPNAGALEGLGIRLRKAG
jgi:hypothetical protein